MNKFKKIIVFLIFMLLISANAYASNIYNISATVGFDGKIKVGCLNPFKVNIEAEGKDFNGHISIDTGSRQYKEPVNISQSTEKDFYFTIPFSQKDSEVIISLEEGNKKIAEETIPIERFQKNTMLIGVLSDEPERLNYLKELNFKNPLDINFEVFDMKNYLDLTLNELEEVDYIVLENYDTEKIPEKFQENLLNWIKNGHSIFVGTKKYPQKTLTGVFEELDSREQLNLGYGNIVPLNMDLEDEPKEYVEEMMEKYSTYLNYMGLDDSKDMVGRINKFKELFPLGDLVLKPEYRVIYFFLSLIAIYLVLVGVYTKREKKNVFGILILCFSAMFFVSSFFISAADNTVGEISIEEYGKNFNSHGITYVKSNKNNMNIDLDEYYLDNFMEGNSELSPTTKKVSYTEEGDYHIYTEDFEKMDDLNIVLTLDEDDILRGEFENPLPSTLENSFFLIGDTLIDVGTLKPKEKVNIEYKLDYNLKDEGNFNYLNKIFKTGNLENEKRQLFEHYYFNIDDKPYNCQLIGFSTGKGKVNIDGKAKKVKKYTMNIFDLTIESGENANVPLGVIKPVVFYTGSIEESIKRECTIEDNHELTAIYPIPTNIDAKDIDVNLKIDSGNPELYVLNREEKSWEPLKSEVLQGEHLDKYVSNGPLAIKVVGSSRVIIPQISVTGKYRDR